VLLALWECDGLSVGELAERLRSDYGTLSPLLKRLQAADLVRRERRAEDERSVRVTLTDAGRALRAQADCISDQVLAGTGLDRDTFESLRDTLQRLTASLGAA
jgi:DNA-binding MarR family transcriptional regulator